MKKLALLLILAGLVLFCACSSDKKSEDAVSANKEVKAEMKTETKSEANPFFSDFDTPFNVPPFDQIKVAHYIPAIKEGIKQEQAEIDAIVNNTEAPTFANTIEAMEKSGAMLTKTSYVFGILLSCLTNEEMQNTAKEIAPMMAKHVDSINLNEKLFARIKKVHEQKDTLKLTGEQSKMLDDYYKEFVRGGANLKGEQKTRFKAINEELSVLGLKFGDNILKETNNFKMVVDKKEDLAGLPQSSIDAATETAKEHKLENKWVFTIHKPSLIPFLQYSEKRELREKMYKAYINQGNNNNDLDNKVTLLKILALRAEKAKILGFKSHAHFKLDNNMAKTPKRVEDFLIKLWKPALELAKKERTELQDMVKKDGKDFKLEGWDWWYYSEKLKKAKYALDDEQLRPYFKLENVREGAFAVANKLWGITFTELKDVPTYHKDAKVFEVKDADGTHIGIFYADYFPRASKRGGAWMSAFRKQSNRGGKMIRPVISNNGNFSKPTADKPSLLIFDEVNTLFHEFGHALHGLLTQCTYEKISGTDVALDFVELPSQIMENWTAQPEVLKMYAKHYKTGEVIPQELVDKVKKAALFNQGFATVEYLAASLLDLQWHMQTSFEGIDVNKFENDYLNKIGLIPEIVSRYRTTYFRHIFSSMYSAGYYSYVWAEVLDADAFEAFKEKGLFHKETATAYRKFILEKGGTEEAMELYKKFRGREPKVDPLLKKRGLN
jgi:peptidyl-dipeptidase Dcp